MALISLRAYNREIESMIDNGQLDEAVAHCRHILSTFPKHIASYRLLGKAHLEQQRISDATDIFQRVLTAIPDDFISNVGMSIIREDENNLDAAIWHMELAYEAQPANIAIQDELRRLYGRRDGMQPPKVRLTRGALARMYAKGGLYDQAIAELHAAISEDPNRPDLQQLLAQMFYQTSQRVEAVETCVNILKKIPLCLEANRILAVSLPEAEGSDAVKNYRQTVISMDPYYAFAEPDAISADQVPENAVNIEKLDWKSGIQIGESPNQPAWATSLGISMDKSTEEKIPDWLKSAEAPALGSIDKKTSPNVSPFIWDTQEVEKIITDTSKPEGDIPDWMKDAGWKPATGVTTPPTEVTKPQEPIAQAPVNDDLEKANLPEWLTGIAPEGVLGTEKQDILPNEDELSNPWLEPHQPGPTDSIIQWLDEKKPSPPTTPPTLGENLDMGIEEEMPDWLKGLDLPQTTPTQEGISTKPASAFAAKASAFTEETANIESVKAETGATSSEEPVKPAVEAQPTQSDTILPPEISESKPSSTAVNEEIPDWLKEIAGDMPNTDAFISSDKESTVEAQPINEPELTVEQPLPAGEASKEEPPIATEETTAQTTPAIAEVLPAAEGAQISEEGPATLRPEIAEAIPVPEMPGTIENQPSAEAEAISEGTPILQMPEIAEAQPVTEIPLTTENQSPGEVQPIIDEIPNKEQPVVAEALPEAEMPAVSVNLPTAETASVSEEVPSTELPVSEEEEPAQALQATTESLPEVEIPSITEELQTAEVASISEEVPTTEPQAFAEELPVIEMPTVAAEQPQADQPLPVKGELAPAEPASTSESDDFAWLERLVGEQAAKQEELITPTPEGEITPPEWVKLESEPPMEKVVSQEPQAVTEAPAVPAVEIPEWIKGLGEEPENKPAAEVPVTSVPAETEAPKSEELPAWILEMEQPVEEIKPPISPTGALEWKEDELPAWLKEITESEESEKVPAATEVHPAEEIPAPMIEPASERTTEEIISTPVESGEKAQEEPVEKIKPPISPTGALEWKEDELPAWLKEITETIPAEEAATTKEASPIEEIPTALVEPTSERTEEIVTSPVETSEKAPEVAQPETGPWVPEVEEPVQLVPSIPLEAEAEPVPVMEELTTKAVEVTPTARLEQVELPVEMVSEVDKAALADARNAISQAQPSQAIGFYSGLIKHNYRLDEIIKDLQDALYRFPGNVDMWVTLGDAHYRSNDYQEALNAYTRAEELVR
jgi:tetratricopeptide (TPR) repeat protein